MYIYDTNGRLVPKDHLDTWERQVGDTSRQDWVSINHHSRVEYQYDPPFVTRDRECDLRNAYREFSERLAKRLSRRM